MKISRPPNPKPLVLKHLALDKKEECAAPHTNTVQSLTPDVPRCEAKRYKIISAYKARYNSDSSNRTTDNPNGGDGGNRTPVLARPYKAVTLV